MDHLFKALDEHIAHQEWLLKCERNAKEALEKENSALRDENAALNAKNADLIARSGFKAEFAGGIGPVIHDPV